MVCCLILRIGYGRGDARDFASINRQNCVKNARKYCITRNESCAFPSPVLRFRNVLVLLLYCRRNPAFLRLSEPHELCGEGEKHVAMHKNVGVVRDRPPLDILFSSFHRCQIVCEICEMSKNFWSIRKIENWAALMVIIEPSARPLPGRKRSGIVS